MGIVLGDRLDILGRRPVESRASLDCSVCARTVLVIPAVLM